MDFKFKILLRILGLDAIATFIERLEFADWIYQATRGLPQPSGDLSAVVVIGLIIVAAKAFDQIRK